MSGIPNLGEIPLLMPPEPNISIQIGDDPGIAISVRVSYTPVMRLKWWLFSKLFPVRYEWLEEVG